MRKIEREPNGAGIFRPGQDLVVAGTVGKNGVKAALSAKEKEISARFPEWFVKRIREQADKKSELTPEMLNACGAGEWEEISVKAAMGKNFSIYRSDPFFLEVLPKENGKKFRRAAYWPPFGPYRELTSRGFPLN